MDAEILFFMMEKDEANFVTFAKQYCDSIVNQNGTTQFNIGDCKLLFTRSILEDKTMYCGKLEIRLGRAEFDCVNQEKAKSVFRKLRN